MLEGEELSSTSLPSKYAGFCNFLGFSVVGFEKEITSLLRKMEARTGVKFSKGSGKFSSTCLEKEIQKLECLVNYNCSPLSIKGKGGSNVVLVLYRQVVFYGVSQQ